MKMFYFSAAVAFLSSVHSSLAFVVPQRRLLQSTSSRSIARFSFSSPRTRNHRLQQQLSNIALFQSSSSSPSSADTTDKQSTATDGGDPLGLTPELRKITNAFGGIGDDKLRYKQLMYMANQLPAADPSIMIPANKVPGCLSTVYVDVIPEKNSKGEVVINYVGDSDGVLTKGLVALLVRGLSGCTADEIERVDPSFIQEAKISQSLTPGRNNGFLNMLATMKKKAREAADGGAAAAAADDDSADNQAAATATADDEVAVAAAVEIDSDRPMYSLMMQKLQVLKPVSLELVDNSHQHEGHAGAKGFNGESHFALDIVSDAFEGLNLVKRHKLIYMLLGTDVMEKIHALQIKAKTPEEVA